LHVYNLHILTFTKLATYSASIVKSNFDNFVDVDPFIPGPWWPGGPLMAYNTLILHENDMSVKSYTNIFTEFTLPAVLNIWKVAVFHKFATISCKS